MSCCGAGGGEGEDGGGTVSREGEEVNEQNCGLINAENKGTNEKTEEGEVSTTERGSRTSY